MDLDSPAVVSTASPSVSPLGTPLDSGDSPAATDGRTHHVEVESEDEGEDVPVVPDPLFKEDMDDEDEAWVYRNLRGGGEEDVTVRAGSAGVASTLKVLKPRNSDAVLSCPCCFNIICMDCQKHERYENQFRAMFVMAIAVDWAEKVEFDGKSFVESVEGKYNKVRCENCATQVGVLDMSTEIYEFYQVLASQ